MRMSNAKWNDLQCSQRRRSVCKLRSASRVDEMVKAAQELIVATPEFATIANKNERTSPRPAPPALEPTGRPYKATVVIFARVRALIRTLSHLCHTRLLCCNHYVKPVGLADSS